MRKSATHEQILKMIQPFDHVIWDWNGTLVDDVELAVEAMNVLLVEHGIDAINPTRYREIFGFPVRGYYEKLGFDFGKVSFERLCDRFIHEYNVKRASAAQLFEGVEILLADLKAQKMQSILSAAAQWHLDEITEHFGIHDFFHYRFGIDDHYASSKLDRGRQLIALSEIPSEKTILIGDTDHDFEVAKELGISCLLVADGHQSPERLKKYTQSVLHGRRSF